MQAWDVRLLRRAALAAAAAVCGAVPLRAATGPQGFVLVSEGNMVTVTGGALTKLDLAGDQIAARVSFSTTNVTIASDPPRRLVYAAASDGKLSVFKADTLERADIAVSGLGLVPIGSAVTPDGRTLLLTTRGADGLRNADDRLDVVSLSTGSWPPTASLSYSVPTGTHPINVMADHAGRYAVVTVRDDPAVIVLDLGTRQTVLRAAMPFGSEPEGLDMHPTQDVAYALTHGANTIEVLDLTQDPPRLVASVPVWSSFGNPQPSKGKFTPNGRRLFVSAQSINRMLLFDTSVATSPVQDKTVSLPVGLQPHGIVFLPDGRAYVANTNNGGANGSISVLQNVHATPNVSGGPILSSLVGPNIFLSFVVDASSPSVPAGLTATAAGSSRIELSWTASADDMGLAGYRVYRDGVWVATPTTNSYTDANLSPSQTYAYEVAAYDAAGNVSAQSAAASATTPARSPLPYESSIFGMHPALVSGSSPFASAVEMGVRWHRPSQYVFWFLVQPDTNTPTYDFSAYDAEYIAVPAGINILANISPDGRPNGAYMLPNSFIPIDIPKYQAFVKAAVERYDGDGYNDAPGLASPILYWQIGNEPYDPQGNNGFATLQQTTYQAIKEACSYCQVLIGGVPQYTNPDGFITNPAGFFAQFNVNYRPILAALNGSGFDILDFHWYGGADGDYEKIKPIHSQLRSTLDSYNYQGVPIWVTEMGAYSGAPAESYAPRPQSEREQAADYFKRFVYSESLGIKKVFPAFGLMEGFKNTNGYFDHTGFIYDGQGGDDLGRGVKKLSYYAYKKMVEKLEGADWNLIVTLQESTGGIHAYRLTQAGSPLWVVWNDGTQSGQLALSELSGTALLVTEAMPRCSSGSQVADYSTAFSTRIVEVANGAATIALSSSSPVFVEYITQGTVATVEPNAASVVALQTASGAVELSLPAQSFAESVQLTLRRPASCPGASAGLSATGVCAEIVLDKPLQPAKAAALTIAYRDGDVAGLDEKKLMLARYDETHRGWVPLESAADAAGNKVIGKTSHFSTFQIMQANPAGDLDGARVYPNPFRPAKGHAAVVIDGLPAGARVSIHTLRGKLVWKADASDAGMAVWPGVNQDGREAASGVYFVHVESGGRRRVLKAAVVR